MAFITCASLEALQQKERCNQAKINNFFARKDNTVLATGPATWVEDVLFFFILYTGDNPYMPKKTAASTHIPGCDDETKAELVERFKTENLLIQINTTNGVNS